jgi:hypothetical protein
MMIMKILKCNRPLLRYLNIAKCPRLIKCQAQASNPLRCIRKTKVYKIYAIKICHPISQQNSHNKDKVSTTVKLLPILLDSKITTILGPLINNHLEDRIPLLHKMTVNPLRKLYQYPLKYLMRGRYSRQTGILKKSRSLSGDC